MVWGHRTGPKLSLGQVFDEKGAVAKTLPLLLAMRVDFFLGLIPQQGFGHMNKNDVNFLAYNLK